MKTSDAGLKAIMAEEGVVLHQYRDQVGKRTVGVGHLCAPDEPQYCEPWCDWRKRPCPRGISPAKAMELLRLDVVRAENAVNGCVVSPLNQNQFDALVSLVFNIGVGAFARSTLLRLLNAGDYRQAAGQFAVWRMGGGKVLPVLVARRARERALFEAPPTESESETEAKFRADVAEVRKWAFDE